jgi:SAM-dependent methyltransferase
MNYDEYVLHQASKLPNHLPEITAQDEDYEQIVYNRYINMPLTGKTVLCLGARLGGEVRAFKRLGALAIGIDLNPGTNNPDVLYGDFHRINFSESLFDVVFCNSIDHVYYMELFLTEVLKVLIPGGLFLCEIAIQKAGPYETIDTQDISGLKAMISDFFQVMTIEKINNGWKGELLILQK